MSRKNPDKEDTQEIKLPKSRTDYGDNFEKASYIEESIKRKKHPRKLFFGKLTKREIITITSIIGVIIIVVITIAIAFSNQPTKQDLPTSISSTINSSNTTTNSLTTTSSNVYINETKEQTTVIETTEPTTVPTTTFSETIIEKTDNKNNSTENNQETEAVTSIEKYLSVSDILVLTTDDGLFIPKITGTFNGYSPDELLDKVTVTVSSGEPSFSVPHIEGNTSFTFNLNLDGCKGELHIHLDNYDFYQSIDSFPN